MHSLVISFLGHDCPGIVAAVSSLLEEAQCDIVAVSQTISNGEFAAVFTVLAPSHCTVELLHTHVEKGLAARQVDLSVIVRPANPQAWCAKVPSAPFVVTAHGPNSVGLMASLSGVFARHGVNIENLKAIMHDTGHEVQNTQDTGQKTTDSPHIAEYVGLSSSDALFVFEVMVPLNADAALLRQELQEAGQKFSLRVSMQHSDIFEAIHRISPM